MKEFDFLKYRTPVPVGEEDCLRSAVGIPLLAGEEGWEILFEKRSETVGHQPGDVCFPGGRMEPGETPRETAVREMQEELLVRKEQIRILGEADYLASGQIRVYPFVCLLQEYHGSFSRDEVAEVFTVPWKFFLEHEPDIHSVAWKPEFREDFPFHKIHGGRNYGWRERREEILFYEYEGHVIWGMTAKILHEFVRLYRNNRG